MMMTMRPWRIRGLEIVPVIAVCLASSANAQAPKEQQGFKNLQILPKDIARPELIQTMRSVSGALGVRCVFCHVGEEGKPMDTWDFAADDKPEKKIARTMMQMTTELNSKWVSQLKSADHTPPQIACATCHHGKSSPRSLQDVLGTTVDEKGVTAAVSQYRELRDKYYGRDAYDFGEPPLNILADKLSNQKKNADAITLLELNAEFNPKSATVQGMLGSAYQESGAKDKAIAAYKKALELNPNFEPAKRKLAELQGGK